MTLIYDELYTEWFNNNDLWFSKKEEYDKYVSDKYFSHIKKQKIDFTIYGSPIKTQIGAILLYDQISRHHNRIEPVNLTHYTKLASSITRNILGNLVKYDNEISAIERCFILLPYRHLNNFNKVLIVIFHIFNKYKESKDIKDKNIYKKYLYNTFNKSYAFITSQQLIKQINNEANNHSFNRSFSKENTFIGFNSILDYIPQNPIKLEYSNSIKDIIIVPKNTNIIVSLSGGVDSNVCLYLIYQYLLKNPEHKNNICAVHINYNNRDTTDDELKFIKKYCKILDIKLYYRTIYELKREEYKNCGLRDLYEDITKKIRFDMYRQCMLKQFDYNKDVLVILGHNRDDCFENIITNISNKSNYPNLSCMTKLTDIDGVKIWRPLLDISKQQIIKIAKDMMIPYLEDSTPKWSVRGKIRDIIKPSLKLINEDIDSSFFDLQEYIKNMEMIINDVVLHNIEKKLIKYDNTIEYEVDNDELITELCIWNKIFRDKIKIYNISHKSLIEYVECLKRFKEKFDNKSVNVKSKYIINKYVYIIYYKTNTKKIKITFINTRPLSPKI